MDEYCKEIENKIIHIDEQEVNSHSSELVKKSVEQTLNQLLDEEATIMSS